MDKEHGGMRNSTCLYLALWLPWLVKLLQYMYTTARLSEAPMFAGGSAAVVEEIAGTLASIDPHVVGRIINKHREDAGEIVTHPFWYIQYSD